MQAILIQAAKLAPLWNEQLAMIHAKEIEKENRNRATLALAGKLAVYLLSADKGGKPFEIRSVAEAA